MQPLLVRSPALWALVLCASVSPVQSQDAGLYRYTVIADERTATYAGWSFANGLTLNNDGFVTFAMSQGVLDEIRLSDGAVTAIVATANTPGAAGRGISAPVRNNRGQIVYVDNPTGQTRLALWENGSTSTYLAPGNNTSLITGGISDNLRYADQGIAQAPGNRLVIRGPNNTVIANTPVFSGPVNQQGSISTDGRFAVMGHQSGPSNAMWSFAALTDSGFSRSFDIGARANIVRISTAINNHGMAAVVAEPASGVGGVSFVSVVNTGSSTARTIANTNGSGFVGFGSSSGGIAINNLNEVAYVARTGLQGRTHLMVGDAGGRTPMEVIGAGDVLSPDGAVLVTLAAGMSTAAFNDRGQVAFLGHFRDAAGRSFDAIVRADPLAGVTPSNPILPTPEQTLPGGGWRFQPVVRGRPVFVDPEIAIGYSYTMEAGGPNFASVYVPAPLANGDDSFRVEFAAQSFELRAGEYFAFTNVVAGGVSSFRITGIDTREGLDPNDPQAFVAGLVFTEGGNDTAGMVMKPITAAVPEPAPMALMLGGLGVLGCLLRARRCSGNVPSIWKRGGLPTHGW